MIKSIVINGEKMINLPSDVELLVELGLTREEAENAVLESESLTAIGLLRLARKPLLIEADGMVNIAMDNDIDIAPYRKYRQELRDITIINKTLEGIVWPTKPQSPQS